MLRPTVQAGSRHVVVVGAGGNIGSHLVPHLARMPEIGRLTLIDPDRYEPANLRNQAILPAATRQQKAEVQARLARQINPRLQVAAIAEPVERVPLGRLRCDLILGCLDSRRSRQHLNEAALRLGIAWLDAGVLTDGLLARLDCFAPDPGAPCLECGWSDPDYAALEQSYACGATTPPHPTGAPSGLGALAAALQAIECQKRLAGDQTVAPLPAGHQLVIGASQHLHYRTTQRRNPACRLGSHEAWVIELVSLGFADTTIGGLVDRLLGGQPSGDWTLAVFGGSLVTELVCHGCAMTRPVLRLASSMRPADLACIGCGDPMVITGLRLSDRLRAATLRPDAFDSTLEGLGLRSGEVISLDTQGGQRHFELRARPEAAAEGTLARTGRHRGRLREVRS